MINNASNQANETDENRNRSSIQLPTYLYHTHFYHHRLFLVLLQPPYQISPNQNKEKKQKSKMTPCSCNACSTSCSGGCDGCKCASCGVCIYLSTPTYTLFSFFPFFYLLKKARRCQSADPILGIALRQDTLRTISSPAGCEKEMI